MFEICDILSSYFSLTCVHVHFSIATRYDRFEPIFDQFVTLNTLLLSLHVTKTNIKPTSPA